MSWRNSDSNTDSAVESSVDSLDSSVSDSSVGSSTNSFDSVDSAVDSNNETHRNIGQHSADIEQTVEQRKHRMHNVFVTLLASLSAIIFIAVSVIFATKSLYTQFVDDALSPSSSITQRVTATNLKMVCPSRLAISESSDYGDSQYRESDGNISSYSRYAVFGNMRNATVRNARDNEGFASKLHAVDSIKFANKSNSNSADSSVNSDDSSVNSDDSDDSSSSSSEELEEESDAENSNNSDSSVDNSSRVVFYANKKIDKDSQVLEGKLSSSDSGTGLSASSSSWASNGDLRGLSASSCVIPSRSQTFLVPEVDAGTSIRLISVNSSSKPTIVQIRMWSVEHSSSVLALSTGSTFTVDANSESTFDIAAAASLSKGLYVQVLSEQAPVASFMQYRRMQGLVVKGVDIIQPLESDCKSSIIPGVSQSDNAKLYIWSRKSSNVNISWMDDEGSKFIKTVPLQSQELKVVDLGKVPDKVSALKLDSNNPIASMVELNRKSDGGQEDVAFATRVNGEGYRAIVTPVNPEETSLYLASSGLDNASVKLKAFDYKGDFLKDKTINIRANSSLELKANDIDENAVMFEINSKSNVAFAARLHKKEVDDAHLASVAWIKSQSLEPQQVSVKVTRTQGVVK